MSESYARFVDILTCAEINLASFGDDVVEKMIQVFFNLLAINVINIDKILHEWDTLNVLSAPLMENSSDTYQHTGMFGHQCFRIQS